jgi:hypothetical protein
MKSVLSLLPCTFKYRYDHESRHRWLVLALLETRNYNVVQMPISVQPLSEGRLLCRNHAAGNLIEFRDLPQSPDNNGK